MSQSAPLDIAITGAGVVSSIGIGLAAFQDALAEGRVAAVAPPFEVADDTLDGVWVSPVAGFAPGGVLPARVAASADPATLFALAAAQEAVEACGGEDALVPDRTAVVMGTALSAVATVVRAQHALSTGGPKAFDPKLQTAAWPNLTAAQIMLHWRLSGPLLTIATACASSLDSIGIACGLIARGEADMALAGGGDSAVNALCVLSARRFGMVAPQADGAAPCRPFGADRDGIMVGEGAGIVVLEPLARAAARGARVLGVVRGYASGADPHHITAPDPSGAAAARTMRRAIAHAGLLPSSIDAVIAHATGTPLGDATEIRALVAVLGEGRAPPPATSIKGHVGHTTGAAGVMGVAAALGAIARQELPPTAGTRVLDAEVSFPVPLGRGARRPIRTVLVNAFGFGGQNASLVVAQA